MEVKEGYKLTEVGVIPEDWMTKPFDDLVSIRKQKYNSQVSGTYDFCIELEHIEQGTGSLIGHTQTSFASSLKNTFKENDILFGRLRAYLKKYWKANRDGVSSSEIWSLIANNQTLPDYVFQVVQSNFFLEGASETYGTHMPRSDWNIVKNLIIPLPPTKAEQTAIAKALSDTDALIQSLQKLIAKKQSIKQGAMQLLLTGKKRLPGFAGEWEVKKLGELVDFTNGKAHERSISDHGRYIVVNSKFISTDGEVIKYSNDCFCPVIKGSSVMVMSDVPNGKAIAKCFFIERNDTYTINQRICILHPRKIDAKFLFFIINRNAFYLTFDDGVKQTNLRKEDVLKCELRIPRNVKEQSAIAQVILDMDNELSELERKLSKYKLLKQGMMQNLLTGKIRLV